jgi:triacylglycerol lipase
MKVFMSQSTVPNAPVILLPGTNDKPKNLFPLQRACNDAGFEAEQWAYINDLSIPLPDLVDQFAEWIDSRNYGQIHLVGMSMGGLIAAAYIQCYRKATSVLSYVNIAGPLNGTMVAYLSDAPGALDMRPQSAFIRQMQLTQNRLVGVPCTTIRTPMDLMIVPSTSSCLQGAVANHVVLNPGHGWLLYDRRVHRIVLDAIGARVS